MQTARHYIDDITMNTQQALERMRPKSKRQSAPQPTRQDISNYVNDLLSGKPQPQSLTPANAANRDIEHFIALEEFLSSEDECAEIVALLDSNEQSLNDSVTD